MSPAPKRWRVKRLHESPAELFFPQGISEPEIRQLYSDCFVEPIADSDRAAPPSREGDDET